MTVECEGCGRTVSDVFARVQGDNDNRVYGCPWCTTREERKLGASAREDRRLTYPQLADEEDES